MRINLTFKVIDEILKDVVFLTHHLSYSIEKQIKEKTYTDENSVLIDLSNIDKKDCELLEQELIKKKYNGKTINAISNWIKNISNPKNAIITSLPMLEKTLKGIVKESKSKWLLMTNPDNMIVPSAVISIKYKNRTRDDDPCVVLSLNHISIKSSSDHWSVSDKEIRKEKINKTVYFYKNDISEIDEDDFFDLNFDDEDKPKPKVRKSKKEGSVLSEILSKKNLMFINDDFVAKYEKDIVNANHISKKIGNVFVCENKGFIIPDSKTGLSNWKDLNDDNKRSKLVIDELKLKDITATVNTDFGSVEIPEQPYVLTYDITSYRYAVVHINNISPYKYNPNLIEKLVISDKRKKILSSLIGSKNNFEDLIAGKSGGIVILSTGESGLGKTLTAEVYSEVMEKPLYCVQSSQLGIRVDDIEKNLNKILNRAEKWDAVLLIDEADSYIYKRGNDILQNCIVGTFLRLMEYYNGILFLTSNRPDTIDDAIISRVTLHIKYDFPNYDESVKLWNILSENFKMEIDNQTIIQIWGKYEPFSGRDIRNTLKDISKCFPKQKNISLEMIEELEDFLPFIKIKK
jgi:hypothetical protein